MHGAISSPGRFKTCSVKTAGSPCRLQGCWDEDVYVADLHVGETHVRLGVRMLPVLWGFNRKSHVSSHMHESVCFSRFRFRPSDAQSQCGLPHMSSEMKLCLELRPADFGTSNCGACSEAVVGLGWSSQALQVFMVFEDNSGDCSKIASLLPNERVWPCVRSCAPKSGHFRC